MQPKKYLFASCRGQDYYSEGNNPTHAWELLLPKLELQGQVYRCVDHVRNRYAVQSEGFTRLTDSLCGPVYKEV